MAIPLNAASGIAGDYFTYEGINYCIIDKDAKTCKTRSYKTYNTQTDEYTPGNEVSGDIILPEVAYCDGIGYTLVQIGKGSFCNNIELKSVSIPNTVDKLETLAFFKCPNLEDVSIPESVAYIGIKSFFGCAKLKTLTLNGNLTIDLAAFDGEINPLIIRGEVSLREKREGLTNTSSLGWLNPSSKIICRYDQISKIRSNGYKGQIASFDVPFSNATINPLYGGGVVSLVKNDDYEGTASEIIVHCNIARKSSNESVIEDLQIKSNEDALIQGLQPAEDYLVTFSWEPQTGFTKHSFSKSFTTLTPKIVCQYTSTQTTATINSVEADKDESVSPTIYIKANGKEVKYTGGKYEIKGLQPDKEYSLVYADYNGKRFDASSQTTKKVGLKISVTNEGSTSFKLSGSYQAGDAEIASAGWETMEAGKWKKIDDKNEVVICGLKPGSTHDYRYFAQIKGYGHIYSTVITKTLPALELNMLKPKCVSSTNAIVAAETNVADAEPNVGFQWKKYDAPASLAPNEGYAVVYDGVLEGYIRNLQTTSYYNVRAFYKDAENNYYFSDWTTFDPSDFSFFEPTVRTYPTEQIGQNNATLCGYVLAGTDDIISQGFQYWLVSSPQNVSLASVPSTGVFTVEAQGQLMTAVLDGLRPDSKYAYRAFVQTKAGYMYGDEQSFKTLEVSGVEDVLMERSAPEIVGYYDLTGRRYTEPRRGLNIVVYSDGSSRKEYIR